MSKAKFETGDMVRIVCAYIPGTERSLRVRDVFDPDKYYKIVKSRADLLLHDRVYTLKGRNGTRYGFYARNLTPANHATPPIENGSDKYGHPRVYEILNELAALHSKKNKDYTQGGRALGNFERRSNLYKLYPNLNLANPVVVAIVDSLKQLDAALWMLANDYEGKVENVSTRLRDVAVYAVLAMVLDEESKKCKK